VKQLLKRNIVLAGLGVAAALTGGGAELWAREKSSGSKDRAVERARQEVKMLDDLYKNLIVLIDGHYVINTSDFPATSAAKALSAAMKKDGWYEARVVGLTGVLKNAENAPQDDFEKAAAKKLRGGDTVYEELVTRDAKRYLRVATAVPMVSEHCVMCHTNFEGDKGNVAELSYTVPVIE